MLFYADIGTSLQSWSGHQNFTHFSEKGLKPGGHRFWITYLRVLKLELEISLFSLFVLFSINFCQNVFWVVLGFPGSIILYTALRARYKSQISSKSRISLRCPSLNRFPRRSSFVPGISNVSSNTWTRVKKSSYIFIEGEKCETITIGPTIWNGVPVKVPLSAVYRCPAYIGDREVTKCGDSFDVNRGGAMWTLKMRCCYDPKG